jgi:drug/metabolite transporter (DMT)-like permease
LLSGGVLYGLGAALGWGLSDFMVALVARRIGSFVTLVLAQVASLACLSVLLATGAVAFPRWHAGLVALPAIGILAALSYTSFYRALLLGPIALVSPVVAGYAAVVIALSLTIGGETIPALQLAGAAVTIGGVVLASTDPRLIGRERPGRERPSGPFLAALAMVGFGVGAYLIGFYSKSTGWFGTVYLSRAGTVAVLLLVGIGLARRRVSSAVEPVESSRPVRAFWSVTILIGALDVAGFASFARGSELGFISITAAASVIYPLIPILFGVLHFRERPAPSQWAGVAVVGAGLTLLTLGR